MPWTNSAKNVSLDRYRVVQLIFTYREFLLERYLDILVGRRFV